MKKSGRILDRILNAMAVLSGIFLLFIMLLVCYDVIMRYFFRNPTGWSMEICEYALVYITFLGSPWLLREQGHVNVDILFFFFPSMEGWCTVFTNIAVTGATFFLTIFTALATWDYFQRGITMIKILTIPKWVVFWIIPFGCLFLFLESSRQLYTAIKNAKASPARGKLASETEKN